MDSKITMIVKNNELYKLSWAVLPEEYINNVMKYAEKMYEDFNDFNDDDAFDLMIDEIDNYLSDEHRNATDDFHEFSEMTSKVFEHLYAGVELDKAENLVFDN